MFWNHSWVCKVFGLQVVLRLFEGLRRASSECAEYSIIPAKTQDLARPVLRSLSKLLVTLALKHVVYCTPLELAAKIKLGLKNNS